jgi:3',5'-nucleoside bisphosphate phosphatase
MGTVDLHIHTTASDGKFPPVEVVRKAWNAGLRWIAICDHDSVDGIMPALAVLPDFPNMIIISGVEINTDIPAGEVHILGYIYNYSNQELHATLKRLRGSRIDRAKKMVSKLRGVGLKIDYERVEELAGAGSLGRPHIAQALLEKGYINNFREAFTKYIGRGGPAYVERDKITPEEAIQLIRRAGGIPVLAHPLTSPNHEELIQKLIPAGLLGIEAYYNSYSFDQVNDLLYLANKYNLIVTGGSDFHGLENNNEMPLGTVDVPQEVVTKLIALSRSL